VKSLIPSSEFRFEYALPVDSKDVVMVVRLLDDEQTLDVWCPHSFTSGLTSDMRSLVVMAVDDYLRNVPK